MNKYSLSYEYGNADFKEHILKTRNIKPLQNNEKIMAIHSTLFKIGVLEKLEIIKHYKYAINYNHSRDLAPIWQPIPRLLNSC